MSPPVALAVHKTPPSPSPRAWPRHPGYYVERTVEDGTRYCRGKVMEIKDQVGELSRILQQRQQILSRVEVVLAQKAQG
ncbi:MAG: hypothetical protein ABGY24_17655 [bacterium]